MSGFQDTGTVAIGILAIGPYLERQVLVWLGFMVIGKVLCGIQAIGGGRTPAGIYGRPDIATLMAVGIGAVGEDLRGHLHIHQGDNCYQNSGSFFERATIFTHADSDLGWS